MRVAAIVVSVLVGLVLVGLIALELSATALATRSARQAVERCVEVEDIEVTSLARPAIRGLLTGEVRDVRVRASGIEAGSLRIAQVDARLPVVPLWGGAPESTLIVAEASLVEADLERYLTATAPDFASPTVRITPDGLEIGDERVPFTLGLRIVIAEPGLQLVPTLGDPRLWSSLGLELDLEVPDALELTSVDLADGVISVTGRVEVIAGVDREPNCPDVALLGVGEGRARQLPDPRL